MLRLKSTGHLEWALEPSSHLETITPFKTTAIGTKASPASVQFPYYSIERHGICSKVALISKSHEILKSMTTIMM